MLLALAALGIVSLIELLLSWKPLWTVRRYMAPGMAVVLASVLLALLTVDGAPWSLLVAVFGAYRCFNLSRIAAGRMQADYLLHASRKTALWLIGLQALIAAGAWISDSRAISSGVWWVAASWASLGVAFVIAASLWRHMRTTSPPALDGDFNEARLPSLTVAIPARNETADLEECLASLAASTYPKLEILVLDDCSQDKRTPEIIRSFAHAGVRFIAGTEPPGSWLAKNYAYSKLAEEANGELLVFCGVDVRFRPDSLKVLVKTLLRKRKRMISVLPRDISPSSRSLAAWFMQPNRYAWELALPRRLIRRPPALSTCWLITREALEKAGGFEAVRRKGVPESYFARDVAADGDGYSFLCSDGDLGIDSVKAPDEQRATAIRTRYLQLHRRPELVALVSLAELGALVLPLFAAAAFLAAGNLWAAVPAGAAFLLETVTYARLVNLAYRRFIAKGLWLLAFAAAYDVALLNYSMWKYEFSEVLWKGRNVCIPVMRIIPALPQDGRAAGAATEGSARRR